MPTHLDAIGYIRDLGHSEGVAWLEMICDLAASGQAAVGPEELEILVQLFIKRASYIRQPTPRALVVATGFAAASAERLEAIGPFNEFKRLGSTLVASFPKRITVIFGANGSGKSSICEALQILASPDAPRRPHNNVHAISTTPPSFSFKLSSNLGAQTWTAPGGYGSHSSLIKYFDSGIAVSNVRRSVQPGRIIELTPFKLNVFEAAKDLCASLRAELQRRQAVNARSLSSSMEIVSRTFSEFRGSVLSEMKIPTATVIDTEIKVGSKFSEKDRLDEKLIKKADLVKATSEEGVKILKSEVAAIKTLKTRLDEVLTACEKLIEIDPVTRAATLKELENEQEILAKALIPTGASLEKLMSLVRSASELCTLHSPETAECPLCKRELGEHELEIFKKYAGLLTGDLDASISQAKAQIDHSKVYLKLIFDSAPDEWSKNSVLPSEIIDPIMGLASVAKDHFVSGGKIDQICIETASSLKSRSDALSNSAEEKERIIQAAGESRAELLKELAIVTNECETLRYAKTISENIDLLRETYDRTRVAAFWEASIPEFPSVLRKVTAAAKKAHKELVVKDFKARLDSEYLALAEKDMGAFGVDLKDIGGEGVVTVDHHVAGQKLDDVLSEGEQRVHSLALFFAELETCAQPVIVFDDPISSFDYNYIGNYCNRLRDFVQNHPGRQVIILTHNWEFFVQIQTALNVANLSNHMAVHVLEGCSVVSDYSENVDDLKADIESVLSMTGEPSKKDKEAMAGKMRRLIEAIVNTHVFNKQRHQFKQKSQQVSAFTEFTKLVPLLATEAQTLRDLFAKLSISEHDDPRNAYVNTDKAMFATRYNSIKAVESAIVGRK